MLEVCFANQTIAVVVVVDRVFLLDHVVGVFVWFPVLENFQCHCTAFN